MMSGNWFIFDIEDNLQYIFIRLSLINEWMLGRSEEENREDGSIACGHSNATRSLS